MIPADRRLAWLSDRERVVLLHMMDGLSAEQIAAADYVTVATVRSQIRSILLKLGVTSQLAAVALAYRTIWPSDDDHFEVFARVVIPERLAVG